MVSRTLISVPAEIRSGELRCIVSVSGGKDSTACALALREAGVPFSMVFADTGWEAKETLAHLDHLREKLGPIDVVSAGPNAMAEKIRQRAGFPSRLARWCTQELKIEPLRRYFDEFEKRTGEEAVSVLGIRAEESEARAKLGVFVDEPEGKKSWGGWVWRPIMAWSIGEVLAIHHRHGVEVNPLYKRGHDRVGCYPCIFARKEEVRLVAEHAPERIDEIRALEAETSQLRAKRNAEKPGRYQFEHGSFFQAMHKGFSPIDEVVEWSKTAHGGKEKLLLPMPTGGCVRWGMCEAPQADAERGRG